MHERLKGMVTDGAVVYACFFVKSKLTIQKWLIAMLWWSREYPVIQMSEEAEIGVDTACDIYQWLQEVCSTKLLQIPI